MKDVRQTLDSFAAMVRRFGGEARPCTIAEPLPESGVTKAERQLGIAFPPRFRRFVTTDSAGLEFAWTLDDDHWIQLEGEREPIFGGDFRWSFEDLVAENATFRAQDIEGDELLSQMVGRDKVIVATVPNGDMFAVGMSGELEDGILYLSHDLGDIHNYVVASDIDDFMRRYAPLGFAGPESWIWEQFTNGRSTMIDPSSAKAQAFLATLAGGRAPRPH